MAVTYNWSYRPGITNKYGYTIPSTADDVRPTGYAYVALWGNDNTGNGSRLKPYRTINKALLSSGVNPIIIVGNGVYRENITNATSQTGTAYQLSIIGDGNVTIDGYTLTPFLNYNNLTLRDINLKNYTVNTGSGGAPLIIENCSLYNVTRGQAGQSSHIFKNNLFVNCILYTPASTILSNSPAIINCTFIRSYVCILTSSVDRTNNNIFYQSNIDLVGAFQGLDFCLFHQCNFRAATSGTSPSTVFYPSVPSGYTYQSTMSGLRSYLAGILTGWLDILPKSAIANPQFNNEAIDDYTLSLSSPARNMSYFGTYIGAYSIARALAVKASGSLSAFDNSSAVNLTIADNSLTLTDVDSIASIVTKPIDNTVGRELQRLITLGINADRNGEYVDSTADLSNTTISAGTTLSVSTPYTVESGAITYDGGVYNAGQRFTSKSSSPGTFTTSTGGAVREILEAPARENVEARFSDGALTTVDNTATLEELAWYFVEGNAVTYNGNSYAVGAFLKVLTGITSFTGTGLLRKVFSNSDAYFYFEINQKPTSNNVGNSRTGAIVRGNGDKDFDRTAANVFPINKKFIQLRYTIQVNNLTP